MNDRPRPRPPVKPKPAAPSGPIQLDDETRNALILFNARLAAQEAAERDKRRVDKAAKAKDDAAANVRSLEANPKATADEKAAAQTAYLAALDAWNRAKSGEAPAADEPSADESATDETTADEPAESPAESPADDATPADAAES